MPGIGIVLNPKSRRNRKNPGAAKTLAKILDDHGVVREARSTDELRVIAEDFKRLGIDVLGIAGGDGTNSVTLTGFLDVYEGCAMPQIAFLRGGTMNTVATSCGVKPGKPEGLLGRLVSRYAARASQPLVNVERHVMRAGSVYGFLFGTGAVHGFLAEYYRGGEPTPLVAAETLLRGVGSTLIGGETVRRMAAPWRGSVTLGDGTVWPERDYLAVAAGTIDHIGLNFRPFCRYDERPGTFHALGIHTGPFGFVCDLPRIQRGVPMSPKKAYQGLVEKMTLVSEGDRTAYMVDGDLHVGPKELEVSIGPRVRIVVG